jgi:hypothetical protein
MNRVLELIQLALCLVVLEYYKGDKIKKVQMDGPCSTDGKYEICTQGFYRKTGREETTQKTKE